MSDKQFLEEAKLKMEWVFEFIDTAGGLVGMCKKPQEEIEYLLRNLKTYRPLILHRFEEAIKELNQ